MINYTKIAKRGTYIQTHFVWHAKKKTPALVASVGSRHENLDGVRTQYIYTESDCQ